MNPGEGRLSWRAPRRGSLAALQVCAVLAFFSGCAVDRANVERNLMASRDSERRSAGVAESYRVACPDVLETRIAKRPELSRQFAIEPTGRIDLGDYGSPRVDGQTLPEIARLIATETGEPAESVEVRVTQFRSQSLFLFGQVIGWQRSVPYRGQETVLDVLQRMGGITLGAEPREVYVVRTHLADSQRPEIFHVDLRAIVMKHDDKTNIRLLPFDQIYVGETKQAQLERAIPPWARPVYESVWRMLPGREPAPASPQAGPSGWVSGI